MGALAAALDLQRFDAGFVAAGPAPVPPPSNHWSGRGSIAAAFDLQALDLGFADACPARSPPEAPVRGRRSPPLPTFKSSPRVRRHLSHQAIPRGARPATGIDGGRLRHRCRCERLRPPPEPPDHPAFQAPSSLSARSRRPGRGSMSSRSRYVPSIPATPRTALQHLHLIDSRSWSWSYDGGRISRRKVSPDWRIPAPECRLEATEVCREGTEVMLAWAGG